jgi:hypothetical protein
MSDFERSRNQELTPQQERAITTLLTSPTLEAAAKKARVSTATLRRWRQEPSFAAAYKEARLALLEASTTALRSAAADAVATLTEIMRSQEARPADRVRSAHIVLESAYKSIQFDEITERQQGPQYRPFTFPNVIVERLENPNRPPVLDEDTEDEDDEVVTPAIPWQLLEQEALSR